MLQIKYFVLSTIIMSMGLLNAELKTFGMPTDSEIPAEEAPTEEAPNEEVPTEEAPNEEAPNENIPEDDQMPSASQDNDINEDQPIKFKEEYTIGVDLGMNIPFGQNLKDYYDTGLNLKLDFEAPFGFSMIGKQFKLSGNLQINNCSASSGMAHTDYNITSFGIGLNTDMSFLDVSIGTGLSTASGTTIGAVQDDYSITSLFVSGKIAYNLPLDSIFKNFSGNSFIELESTKISLYASGIEIFSAPSIAGATTDLITFGTSIKVPVLF